MQDRYTLALPWRYHMHGPGSSIARGGRGRTSLCPSEFPSDNIGDIIFSERAHCSKAGRGGMACAAAHPVADEVGHAGARPSLFGGNNKLRPGNLDLCQGHI